MSSCLDVMVFLMKVAKIKINLILWGGLAMPKQLYIKSDF